MENLLETLELPAPWLGDMTKMAQLPTTLDSTGGCQACQGHFIFNMLSLESGRKNTKIKAVLKAKEIQATLAKAV